VRRLVSRRALPRWLRRTIWAVALGHALAIPGLFILMRYTGRPWADALQAFGWMSAGVIALLTIFMLARDVLWLLIHHGDRLRPGPGMGEDRRRFLRGALDAGVVLGAAGVAGVGHANARQPAVVKRVQIPLKDLPEALQGFKIAQISDLHVGPTIRADRMQQVADAVNAEAPDLIAVTGDLVDGPVPTLAPWVAPLGTMRARHGTFFITGNHEYYSGAELWCAHCDEALGWRVLINAHTLVEHDGARLLVAGVPDAHGGRFLDHHRPDLPASLAGAPAADVRVLLAHRPDPAPEAEALGFDLQLSGHTHGGQFFPITVFIRLAQRFVVGLHRVGRMWLYVNPGTTWWGPPIRLGATQEITILELVRA
ncbi:MAG: metallophosphoesterase, partial [bacterium]